MKNRFFVPHCGNTGNLGPDGTFPQPGTHTAPRAGGPVIRITMSQSKLCPVHRGRIAMSGRYGEPGDRRDDPRFWNRGAGSASIRRPSCNQPNSAGQALLPKNVCNPFSFNGLQAPIICRLFPAISYPVFSGHRSPVLLAPSFSVEGPCAPQVQRFPELGIQVPEKVDFTGNPRP